MRVEENRQLKCVFVFSQTFVHVLSSSLNYKTKYKTKTNGENNKSLIFRNYRITEVAIIFKILMCLQRSIATAIESRITSLMGHYNFENDRNFSDAVISEN